jgi:hypothetical protein
MASQEAATEEPARTWLTSCMKEESVSQAQAAGVGEWDQKV